MKTRILIIDDEADYTAMLKANLQSQGYYEVEEENDERQALTAARAFGPDLILLDVMMPNLDGSEVSAMIRADAQFSQTPVLFLTALVAESDAPEGRCASGGHVFLPKSLPIDRLMECIGQAIEESRGIESAA